MVSITVECSGRSKDPLLTISKSELLSKLKKSGLKGLSRYSKKELCDKYVREQKKTTRKKKIGKGVKFGESKTYNVSKYKGVGQRENRKTKKLKEDVMFKYCIPEIFSKYNLWLKSDVVKFLSELEDYSRPGYDEWLVNEKIIDKNSNIPGDEQIENLKVEIDFCEKYLDNQN